MGNASRNAQLTEEDRQVDDILEAVFKLYGHDFRAYCRAHLKRRMRRRMILAKITDFASLKRRMTQDFAFFEKMVGDFSVCVTEMFRDPSFFHALRKDVIPYLSTQPFIKVWVAGCATGEEAYSLAILLHEEGLYERSLIYATDINAEALETAQHGVFDANSVRGYTENYQKSGGQRPFVDYYTAFSGLARLDDKLKKNILFSLHNLATDTSFGEMHLILCRNVMIYFDRELHNRSLKIFYDSLIHRGFLGIGSKESIRFYNHADDFEEWVRNENIFRRRN